MELRTFIKEALLDLVGGVEDAQKATPPGTIVPGGIIRNLNAVQHGISEVQVVDFTVSVSIDEEKGCQAKLGVISAIIGAGLASDVKSASGQSSVLKFRIPIQFPTSGAMSKAA